MRTSPSTRGSASTRSRGRRAPRGSRATRPSIMSLGATTSAPASTCDDRGAREQLEALVVVHLAVDDARRSGRATCTRRGRRRSSARARGSAAAAREAPAARCRRPPRRRSPARPSPSGMPKRITACTPPRTSSSTSRTTSVDARSATCRAAASLRSDSGATKSGITNWSRSSRVSRTRPRSAPVRRKRRRRTSGKLEPCERVRSRPTRASGACSSRASNQSTAPMPRSQAVSLAERRHGLGS